MTNNLRVRRHALGRLLAGVFLACAGLFGVMHPALVAHVRADPDSDVTTSQGDKVWAYLWNVKVRPGYNFPNDGEALDYGYGICHKIAEGHSYAQISDDVKADFNTTDEYQALYLINQSANELCPAMITQLRHSVGGNPARWAG
ncbi:DUF732 domain-containing protein [[Mycobacterium] vasticus]|uniref:DUF732 domain-containing protein n=1 Tax=[Mycobacterium] vasticus TaxID=2875777 RepID=A0ABU5YZS2_9MYCO|nr:DUF732 domain-containing protein [Mycolicibacter sp. MYC017]MEB3070637.1 DUF732 domain-containing protein [Mycolicibacter sp. MYC017]